jgi:hypothetical protein
MELRTWKAVRYYRSTDIANRIGNETPTESQGGQPVSSLAGQALMLATDNRSLDKKVEQLLACQRKTISGVVGTGKILNEVRELLEHGEYQDWLENNCPWSASTSLRYRRSYEFSTTIDVFASLNLTIMTLYFLADLHADETQEEINKAAIKAIVKISRKRLMVEDEAQEIYDAIREKMINPNPIDPIPDELPPPTTPEPETSTPEEPEPEPESSGPPLSMIHETPAGERTEYLPASPLHFLSALHAILATHTKASDDKWLEQIESNPVEFYKLLDHMNDLRSKREASNSPIKTKADRAEAKAKNGR